MAEFPRQFIIHPAARPAPAGFARTVLREGELALDTHPELPVIPVEDDGRRVGYLLGFPVDPVAARLVEDGFPIRRAPEEAPLDWIDREIYRLAGSYAFVHDEGDAATLYLDAGGTLSAVFDPAARVAASTAEMALGDEYESRLDSALIEAFGARGDGWFTAGLTAHRGLHRLMANHALDLGSFTAARHWPRAGFAIAPDPDEPIAALCDEVSALVAALAKQPRPLFIALTAGAETRALLACARPHLAQAEFFTVRIPEAPIDAVLARRIARRYGLTHRILPQREADAAQIARWTRRTGNSIAGQNRRFHPSIQPLAGGNMVGGVGGSSGRGFLWPPGPPPAAINAVFLADRLKLPRHPRLLAALEEWLARVPAFLDPLQALDVAFVELRMSSWAFSQSYANPVVLTINWPVSRNQIARMWTLPVSMRRGDAMIHRMIEMRWPELMDVPINAFGDIRDRLYPVARALRRPDKAWRKLRQIVRRRFTA